MKYPIFEPEIFKANMINKEKNERRKNSR